MRAVPIGAYSGVGAYLSKKGVGLFGRGLIRDWDLIDHLRHSLNITFNYYDVEKF